MRPITLLALATLCSTIASAAHAGKDAPPKNGESAAPALPDDGGPAAVQQASSLACTGAAGGCFSVHASGGCDDQACCEAVCDFDPACCNFAWDGICVGEAGFHCDQRYLTDIIVNPANGHRYAVASPSDYEGTFPFLFTSGLYPLQIGSGAENEWVRGNLATNIPGLSPIAPRIGLNDVSSEGNFTWINGQPVSYLHWHPGEPNDFWGEDSVQLYPDTGTWNDVTTDEFLYAIGETSWGACGVGGSCFEPHGPGCSDESCCNEICFADEFCCSVSWDEICVDEAFTGCNAAPTGDAIPNPVTGHRYQLITAGTWMQAEKLALELGGHLATINNAAEQEWLRRNIHLVPGGPSSVAIGFHDQAREGTFQWLNHDPVTFTAWAAGEPSSTGNQDATVMDADGTWNDISMSLVVDAVVEIPCAGDLDGDGVTGGPDLGILLGGWGGTASVADITHDGVVDAADLAILLGSWGPCAPSNACFGHDGPGADQPGCMACVCDIDSYCCEVQWDDICGTEARFECNVACQCWK